MSYECKTVIFKTSDMQDFNSLQQGNFRVRNIGFNLQEKLLEIQNIVTYKAQMKGLEVVFETNFDRHLQIVQVVQFDQLLSSNPETNEDHPLYNYLTKIN